MNHLELTLEESEVLHQLLEGSLAALELEIRHTDHSEFRNVLKNRRNILRTLIDKLAQPATTAV